MSRSRRNLLDVPSGPVSGPAFSIIMLIVVSPFLVLFVIFLVAIISALSR